MSNKYGYGDQNKYARQHPPTAVSVVPNDPVPPRQMPGQDEHGRLIPLSDEVCTILTRMLADARQVMAMVDAATGKGVLEPERRQLGELSLPMNDIARACERYLNVHAPPVTSSTGSKTLAEQVDDARREGRATGVAEACKFAMQAISMNPTREDAMKVIREFGAHGLPHVEAATGEGRGGEA
jgi:hypothetical protein